MNSRRRAYICPEGALKIGKIKKAAQPYEWQGRISSTPQVSFANISETVTARALKLFDFSQNIFCRFTESFNPRLTGVSAERH